MYGSGPCAKIFWAVVNIQYFTGQDSMVLVTRLLIPSIYLRICWDGFSFFWSCGNTGGWLHGWGWTSPPAPGVPPEQRHWSNNFAGHLVWLGLEWHLTCGIYKHVKIYPFTDLLIYTIFNIIRDRYFEDSNIQNFWLSLRWQWFQSIRSDTSPTWSLQ